MTDIQINTFNNQAIFKIWYFYLFKKKMVKPLKVMV